MIETFFAKIAQSLAVNYIKDGFKLLYKHRHSFSTYGRYKKSLAGTLAQMPFIYKDVDLEVLEDYVDIEVQYVNTDNLRPMQVIKNSTPLEKLNQNYKALFIGSAGMGKSTFFRYSTLSLIKKKCPYFLRSMKKQIPIFISLKAVPNFGRSPIINSILNDVSFLRHDGVNKLRKLAQKNKVFFLLDGYDEISFANSSNHIRYELGLLLSTTINTHINQDYIDVKYIEIYQAITRCNVWLSTREEFYRLNPIGIASLENKASSKDFIAVKLRGLGDNRLVLVKKIFDKYRARSKKFGTLLDEEVFIEEIDTHQDEELVKLSKRPLFLTILCYIYVNQLIADEDAGRDWLRYLNELVLECIKVLLSDLDKFKVREYSAEQKKMAFVKRRSNFLEEKTEFLKFFAFEMLLSGENIFDAKTLDDYVRRFFQKRFTGEKATEILSEMDKPKSNNPNFVVQLLYSGIFVVVTANAENMLYDFPHRRFKEVLATEALRDRNMYTYFLSKTTNINLSEFILIVFKHYKDRREEIIDRLFQDMEQSQDTLYITQLILNLLSQNHFNITANVTKYLIKLIHANCYAKIYFELLEKARENYFALTDLLCEKVSGYVSSNAYHSLSTTLELLEIISPEALKKLTIELGSDSKAFPIRTIARKFEIKSAFEHHGISVETLKANKDEVSLVALSSLHDKNLNDSFYISFMEVLDFEQTITFWALLRKNNTQFEKDRRLSSVFSGYKLMFDTFIDYPSFEGFKGQSENRLAGDLSDLISAKSSTDEKTEKSKIKALDKEIRSLKLLKAKLSNIDKEAWKQTKLKQQDFENTDFTFINNRIDRHKFYYKAEFD